MRSHICVIQRSVCCTKFIPPSLLFLFFAHLSQQYFLHLETILSAATIPSSKQFNRNNLRPFGCKLLMLANCSIPICCNHDHICLTHSLPVDAYNTSDSPSLTHADLPHHPTPSILSLGLRQIFFSICEPPYSYNSLFSFSPSGILPAVKQFPTTL